VRAYCDPDALISEVIQWARTQWSSTSWGDAPILVYSTASAEEVRAVRADPAVENAEALGVGEAIEGVLAGITQALVAQGVRRIIVAGGETSGAVVRALGVRALRIGPEIAPGVPWTSTLHAADDGAEQSPQPSQVQPPTLALALKSGNFGDSDFFLNAWSRLPC
jgi:uncharacterized protein YgbK (DUF1537 family)